MSAPGPFPPSASASPAADISSSDSDSSNSSSTLGAALGGSSMVISLLGMIYTAINHKHVRSRCCGKTVDFGIDVDTTEELEKKDAKAEAKAKETAKVTPETDA
jgi:hypothetical protein